MIKEIQLKSNYFIVLNLGFIIVDKGKKKNRYYSVHGSTADNPFADFEGEHWVLKSTKIANTRYKNARKESVKYLKKYVKKETKKN